MSFGRFRRMRDGILELVVAKPQPSFGPLLDLVVHSQELSVDEGSHKGLTYRITETSMSTIINPNEKKFDVDTHVTGIKLPYYPRNLTASNLVNEIFMKMIVDYGDPELFRFEADVGFTRDDSGKYKSPFYVSHARDVARSKAINTIDVYTTHKEKLDKVLRAIEKEYPSSRHDANLLVRNLNLPLWYAYRDDNCSPIADFNFPKGFKIFD